MSTITKSTPAEGAAPSDRGSWFIAFFATLLGAVVLLAILWGAMALFNSRHWVAADADVLGLGRKYTASKIQPYQTEIDYRYSWAGQAYRGNKLRHLVDPFSPKPNLQAPGSPYAAAAQRIAAGQAITVYVNPDNPSQSVLINQVGSWWTVSAGLLFAQVLLLFGVGNILQISGATGGLEGDASYSGSWKEYRLASGAWWSVVAFSFGWLLVCGHWQLLRDVDTGRFSALVPVAIFGTAAFVLGRRLYRAFVPAPRVRHYREGMPWLRLVLVPAGMALLWPVGGVVLLRALHGNGDAMVAALIGALPVVLLGVFWIKPLAHC
jgi:hypothetical protein